MNWPMPSYITDEENYQNAAFKLFSSFHTAIGAVFLGSSSLYISKIGVAAKGHAWFKKVDFTEIRNPLRRWSAQLGARMPHYKIVTFALLWILLGVVWYTYMEDNWGVWDSLDYVASSLTGAGYKGISNDSPNYQFVVAALYAAIGVPLTAITIGESLPLCVMCCTIYDCMMLFLVVMLILIGWVGDTIVCGFLTLVLVWVMLTGVSVSSYFEPSDEEKVTKLFADITQQELDFMVEFGLDNGDGLVDRGEFIILMVVRIGTATPELIAQLNERFRELNRRNESDRIHYDDIVAGRRYITPEMRKLMFANRGLSSMNLKSFADATIFHNKVHPIESRSMSNSSDSSHRLIARQISDGSSVKWSSRMRKRHAEKGSDSLKRIERGDSVESVTYSPLNKDAQDSVEASGHKIAKSFAFADHGGNTKSDDNDDALLGVEHSPSRTRGGSVPPSKEDMVLVAAPTVSVESATEEWEGRMHAHKVRGESSDMTDEKSELQSDGFDVEAGEGTKANPQTIQPSPSKNSVPLNLLMRNLRASSSHSLNVAPSVDSRVAPTPIICAKTSTDNMSRRSSVRIEVLGRVLLRLKHSRWITLYRIAAHPHVRIFVAWVLWLITGTLFYHLVNGVYDAASWVQAFFTSVSVGLSMFWVSVPNTPGVTAYTICHMLFGAVALGSVRAAVAHSLAQSKLNWWVCGICHWR